MKPEVIKQLEDSLKQNDGLVQEASFVVMSIDVYRDMMGIGTDEQLAASVSALRQSLNEVEQGKTRLLSDALDELGRKYEVQG